LRAHPAVPDTAGVPRRIILDTDMGSDVDDALCLALAAAAPELELAAVTTVCGDTRLRGQISRRLLQLAGRADVPVYAGRAAPTAGGNTFVWFGHEGVGILDSGEAPDLPDEDAVAAICRIVGADDSIELVTVGPLTNLAAALAADAQLAGRISQLTLMGGHLADVRYDRITFKPPHDYNLCSDPEAALRVLSAGIPTRMIPIDVTMQVWISERDTDDLASSAAPLNQALARALRRWSPGMRASLIRAGAAASIDNAAFMHDPLALACAYDESFCTFEDLWIEVRIEGRSLRTYRRPGPGPGIHRIRCATAVDSRRFVAHFRARLGL
jgi:purine nucleosidase